MSGFWRLDIGDSRLPALAGGQATQCSPRRWQGLTLMATALSLAVVLGAACVSSRQDDTPLQAGYRHWAVYSGDWSGSKYSSLDQIHRGNVSQLRPAWIFRTGDSREHPPTTIECNPIVVEGVAYLTSPSLKLLALEAATGREIWRFDPFEGEPGGGVNRGVAWWDGGDRQRIFFPAGPYLYAVDAATGRPVEDFGTGGRIDLRQDLDRDVAGLLVSATTPPLVFEDIVVVGAMVGEGPGPAAPGHVRGYDARTGRLRWIFHTIPHPGEFGYETWPPDAWLTAGGANAWGGFTLDHRRGWIFFGTGSPAYDHFGGNRLGANLFGNCIIALDVRTGRRMWHYQVVHHDVWDYDLPCPPNLVTVHRDGRLVEAVAQPTKMGHLFVLDRATGVPLFPVEERPVPASDLPGEELWPTQPFPLLPPPYAQQRFTAAEVTDLNPTAREHVLQKLQGMRTGDIFLPPSREPSVVLPQFNGGTDWGGAAWDPEMGVLYVNASNEAEWISMVAAAPPAETTLGELGGRLFGANCSACHGLDDGVTPEGTSSLRRLKEGLRGRQPAEICRTIREGRGQMPAFGHLAEVELQALLAFLTEEQLETTVRLDPSVGTFAGDIPFVATGHNVFRDPEGFPVNRRPWGTLTAIDLNEGRFLWQVPLGTYPELERRGYPPTGTFNMGGPLVTRGGLVFIGAAMDERFRAIDVETGKTLWEYQLDAGAYATPATFEVAGRQYVLVAAGGGGKPETSPGDAWYCFALP